MLSPESHGKRRVSSRPAVPLCAPQHCLFLLHGSIGGRFNGQASQSFETTHCSFPNRARCCFPLGAKSDKCLSWNGFLERRAPFVYELKAHGSAGHECV